MGDCGGLNNTGPHRLIDSNDSNVSFPIGRLLGRIKNVAFLEEMCH